MRHNVALHGQEYPRRPLYTNHHQALVEDGLQTPRFPQPPLPSLPSHSSASPYVPSPSSTSSSHHSSRRGNSSTSSSSRKRSREEASRAAPIPGVAKPLVLNDRADEERAAEKENSRHGANAPASEDSMSRNEKEKEQEKGGEEEEEKDECCICLGEIGEVMGCLTCCEHKFCFGCISQWAEKSNTCPLCKQRFREIIRKTVGGQQGRKKQKTERVRVRRKDYNPWSEEEDEDDSDDDDLDDEDLHWPPSGFLIDSFSLGSMHAPPLYNHHHAHHHHHHHAHQHNSGFPFSFVTQPHVHHAMGLFDMFHRLMFDTARSSYAPHGHGHGHSTSTYASSSSGDELLSEPSSPEVILVDSDGEDTSSLERGRTRREQRTAAADIPAPLALPRPRLPAGPAQEVIDLTLLPDSEDDGDDDDETEADVARRLRRGREQGEPLPTVVVNLEASPGPQVREFARRSGGRIADIIHEQDI